MLSPVFLEQSLFDLPEFQAISHSQAVNFLLPRHYSGRIPMITYAFGAIEDEEIKAVCTFGTPASPFLCRGIAGEEYAHKVIELSRLCRTEDYKKPLSRFVSWCLKQLQPKNLIIVSFSDEAMNHHGYIYQACNFLYTGKSKERTDKYTGGKHARHYNEALQGRYRQIRSAKHRYLYFAGDRRFRKNVLSALRLRVYPYPKGDNSNYKLGDYLKERIVEAVDDGQ